VVSRLLRNRLSFSLTQFRFHGRNGRTVNAFYVTWPLFTHRSQRTSPPLGTWLRC